MSHPFTDESPEHRLALARIIERAVRPVRATSSYKRKIREELLAHLISIYHEEKQTAHDPDSAIANSAKRFGDPVQLSQQLDAAVPAHKRFDFYVERFFAWRPPESGTQYSFRIALRLAFVAALTLVIPLALKLFSSGASTSWVTLRCVAGLLFGLPLVQFLILSLHYKIRDSMFGVFGSPKSPLRVVLYSSLCIFTAVPFVAFDTLIEWKLHIVRAALPLNLLAGLVFALVVPLTARLSGPKEIDETFWSTLQL